MKILRAGIIGVGFIGPAHIEAVRRIGVEVVAITDINTSHAKTYANKMSIPKIYEDYNKLLSDPDIDVIHNCTPNYLHFKINKKILEVGKHVISEKPLATNSTDSAKLVKLASKSGLVNAVNFNYRYHPLIQHLAAMVHLNRLGHVFAIHGSYLQDWLLYVSDWNWRLDTQYAGQSRAVADIGSHWVDLAQFIVGQKITKVFADLTILHKYRKKPKTNIETFGSTALKPSQFKRTKINTEDYGHILIEFADGTKGMVCVSQVSAGRKNYITLEVNGTEKSAWWNQERPNELIIGNRNEPNQLILKDPTLMYEKVKDYAHYPAGHNEGYPTCIKNFCRNVYRHIEDRRRKIDFATFEDGHNANVIVEAILESHKKRSWVMLKYR